MHGVIVNFPVAWARIALHIILKPLGIQRYKPKDNLGRKLARMLTEPNETRSRLTRLVYKQAVPSCPVGQMEEAFHKICAVEDLEKRLFKTAKERGLKSLRLTGLIEEAFKAGILTIEEAQQLQEAESARQSVIKVDDFADDELRRPSSNMKLKRELHVKKDEQSETA